MRAGRKKIQRKRGVERGTPMGVMKYVGHSGERGEVLGQRISNCLEASGTVFDKKGG